MAAAAMVLMTVSLPGAKPSVTQAAEALGVRPAAIDKSFGLISVDPRKNLYAVQVRAEAVPEAMPDGSFNGPFADPRIAPFGPADN